MWFISGTVVSINAIVMVLQRGNPFESSLYSIVTLSFFMLTGVTCSIMLSFLIITIKRTFTDAELNREMK